MSLSTSFNIVKEPIFHCESDPHHLVTSNSGSLQGPVLQSKSDLKLLFLDVDTTMKVELGSILEKFKQRHNRREQSSLDGCDNESCASTQLL